MPELSKACIKGVETWCACLTVAGQTYRRTPGAVADMSEAQAHEALEELRKAATPTVVIQDVESRSDSLQCIAFRGVFTILPT